jgi:hypothetical protein
MDYSTEEILAKLNVTQLKSLVTLYGLEKPHSKSTKSDYVTYIQSSNISLDPRMLVNYFDLNLKPKKQSKSDDLESVTDDLSNVVLDEQPRARQSPIKTKRAKSPVKKRYSSKK